MPEQEPNPRPSPAPAIIMSLLCLAVVFGSFYAFSASSRHEHPPIRQFAKVEGSDAIIPLPPEKSKTPR